MAVARTCRLHGASLRILAPLLAPLLQLRLRPATGFVRFRHLPVAARLGSNRREVLV